MQQCLWGLKSQIKRVLSAGNLGTPLTVHADVWTWVSSIGSLAGKAESTISPFYLIVLSFPSVVMLQWVAVNVTHGMVPQNGFQRSANDGCRPWLQITRTPVPSRGL